MCAGLSSKQPNGSVSSLRVVMAGAVLVAVWVLFQFWGNSSLGYIPSHSLFYWWGYQWVNPRSEAQHGWLILGLSAWLFWRNLRAERTLVGSEQDRPWLPAALAALLGGLALHVLGYTVDQARVSILALLLFVWGAVVLAHGRLGGRAAAFPLAFMIFAIPLEVFDGLSFFLRLGVVAVSHGVCRLVGWDVVRNGTQLLSPDGSYSYDVAAACSGINSLLALSALSLLVGYLNFRHWGVRLGMLALSPVYAFLGNVVRILSIIVAARWFGQEAGARVHDWFGFLIFVVVLGLQLLTVEGLRRWGRGRPISADDALAAPAAETTAAPSRSRRAVVYTGTAVVVAAVASMLWLERLERRPMPMGVGVRVAADGINPVELPAFLGTEWVGRRAEVTEIERITLPEDTGFARKTYVPLGAPQRSVFLSIVLAGRDRSSIHRPEICLVGQGWTIEGRFAHRFALNQAGPRVSVLRVRREVSTPQGRVVVPQLVAYWFIGARTSVATLGERMWTDAVDRVTRAGGNRWAYVLMQTDASAGEEAALAQMEEVLRQTLLTFARP